MVWLISRSAPFAVKASGAGMADRRKTRKQGRAHDWPERFSFGMAGFFPGGPLPSAIMGPWRRQRRWLTGHCRFMPTN